MRRKVIKELHRNYTWKGVIYCLKRKYPPKPYGNDHTGFYNLIFHPSKLYDQACALSEGVFS